MKNIPKQTICTILVSALLSFIFLFTLFSGGHSFVLLLCPVLYYFVILKARKSDTFVENARDRVRLSLLTQEIILWLVFILPFGYLVFFTQPETGHWSGLEPVVMVCAALEPFALHLLVRLPGRIWHRITKGKTDE